MRAGRYRAVAGVVAGRASSRSDRRCRAVSPYGVVDMFLLVPLALISASSFAVYGYKTLFGVAPRREFERYGMPSVRKFVGWAQLLGAVGVLLGLVYAPLGAWAAAGLSLMMALGVILRLRLRDAPRLMAPAASLGIANGFLVILFIMR